MILELLEGLERLETRIFVIEADDETDVHAVLVEVANPGHPYGVRGVGEVPIVPPPAALANAIYRAAGVRMDELPMSPGRVMAKLLAKR